MTTKIFIAFLSLVFIVLSGCQFGRNNGKLILVNNSDKLFYYKLEIEPENRNRMYSFNPDSVDLPFLNIAESDTIEISGQYNNDESVWLYLYTMENSKNEAEMVRSETIGIKFLNETNWAPQVIEDL